MPAANSFAQVVKRSLLLLYLVAVACTALGTRPAIAAAGRELCGPTTARTLAQTHRLRIYRQRTGGEARDVVCSRYSTRRWALAAPMIDCLSSQGCDGRTKIRVAGRWVLQVVEHRPGAEFDPDTRVTVRAAAARRATRHVEVGSTGYGLLWAVALDSRGRAAWIGSEFAYGDQRGRLIVERFGGCGKTRLDAGQDIDPASLQLQHGLITWRNAGSLRSSPTC